MHFEKEKRKYIFTMFQAKIEDVLHYFPLFSWQSCVERLGWSAEETRFPLEGKMQVGRIKVLEFRFTTFQSGNLSYFARYWRVELTICST